MGFTSNQPWYLACRVLAAHLSEVPVAIRWIKCFLFILPHPSPQCALQVQQLAQSCCYGLRPMHHSRGLLKWEIRGDVSHCGRAVPSP